MNLATERILDRLLELEVTQVVLASHCLRGGGNENDGDLAILE